MDLDGFWIWDEYVMLIPSEASGNAFLLITGKSEVRVMKEVVKSAILLGVVGLALIAVPSVSHAATFKVKVFSLKDILASKDPNLNIQAALRSNPIRVSVIDVTGAVPVPLITDMEINPDDQAITFSDEAVVVRMEFSCPGLRSAVLDGAHNVNQTINIVMPEDKTYSKAPCYCEYPPVYEYYPYAPAPKHCFFRRR